MDRPAASSAPRPAPTVRPAATAIVFRRPVADRPPELLMVRRSREMRFAGGAAVFPGGRIDPADREFAALLARDGQMPDADLPDADPDDGAARIAAIRETLEETGLLIGVDRKVSAVEAAQARAMLQSEGTLAPVLARMGWRIVPQVLIAFARWCPMWENSFDTRFYLADLGTGAVEIAVDRTENTHLFWASATEALAMADRGEIEVIYPTRRNLERLALLGSFAEAREHARAYPVRMITPSPVTEDGQSWLTIPDGHGYPVRRQRIERAMRG